MMKTVGTMNSIKMVVRVALASVVFLAFECSAANRSPSVSELLDKYTQALDSTQSFISSWEYSSVGSCNIPSWGMRENNARHFQEGEYRTDNKGRSYEKQYRWDHIDGSHPGASKDNAHYVMHIIGDDFTYRHDRPLGQTKYRGELNYREKGTKGWDISAIKHWGFFERNDTNSAFLETVA